MAAKPSAFWKSYSIHTSINIGITIKRKWATILKSRALFISNFKIMNKTGVHLGSWVSCITTLLCLYLGPELGTQSWLCLYLGPELVTQSWLCVHQGPVFTAMWFWLNNLGPGLVTQPHSHMILFTLPCVFVDKDGKINKL